MTETLLGDLSQVKLFDILKPLLTDKKTGRVYIRGKEEGQIYLEMGDIVHSRTDHLSGENAFFKIMGWKAGRITFDPEVFPKEKTILITTEQLLLNWSSRKQEFEKIKEAIPSIHTVFRLSLQRDGKEKNISPDQWNVLVLANGVNTLAEIGKSLGWDEYKTLKTGYQLVHTGLIEKVEDRIPAKKKTVRDDFFNVLEMELKKAMGPVAPFIIDDKLVELGEKRESLLQERAVPFMEALSEEIPNPQKRSEFLKTTMKLLSLG
jgi:hypothetical protein